MHPLFGYRLQGTGTEECRSGLSLLEHLLNHTPLQVPNRRCGLLMIEELLAGSGV